jgi:ectoine hydroxylase-related dioxygenase (phytanoyl-CoA dioxygenase family)
MDSAARRSFAEQMLADRAIDATALVDRVDCCLSGDYWTSLVPSSSISPLAPALPELPLRAGEAAAVGRHVGQHGYAAVPVFLPAAALAPLNSTVDAVVAADWPPVFAFVFDALWSAARTAGVRALLDGTLGAAAHQVPHVWVHVVPAVAGARGWAPHKDGGLATRSPSRLSIWIPLTDASIENGCMYVLPRSHPAASVLEGNWHTDTIGVAQAVELLSGARALPAAAGSALVWDFDLVHWSGTRTGGGVARRSLSFEFIGAGAEPAADEHPLIACGPADPLPSFETRLRFIAEGILQYSKHDPSVYRFRVLAERLLTQAA